MRAYWLYLAALAVALTGCGTGDLYQHKSKKPPAAALSDPRTWKLSGTVQSPSLAVDGKRNTYARSTSRQPTPQITIDLGKSCLFNAVFIDHGTNEFGYCRRLAVLTSLDGENFTKCYETQGTRLITSACIITPVLARYVRLQVIQPGSQAWSVAEIYIQ